MTVFDEVDLFSPMSCPQRLHFRRQHAATRRPYNLKSNFVSDVFVGRYRWVAKARPVPSRSTTDRSPLIRTARLKWSASTTSSSRCADPLKTESKQELILPQPLKTETKLDTKSDITSDSKNAIAVDLKPVAMDVCLNTSTQLPHGQISNPFSLHLGLTWMGVEFFGLNLGGESRTILQDLPKKPSIDWPAQQNAGPSGGHGHHHDTPPAARDHGLRVRIK